MPAKSPVITTTTSPTVLEKSDNRKSVSNSADTKNTLSLVTVSKEAKPSEEKVTEPKPLLSNGLHIPDATDSKFLADKPSVAKAADSKTDEVKSAQKNEGGFSIQVGVYSDPANVKQLQAKLKQTGFSSHTQKVTTPKGEKIRLRAGSFSSRQEANAAIPKLQKIGLSAMVVSNE